jgi:O-antigen/teichoic acid export membrane protein
LAVSGRFRQTAALEATGAALRTALVLTLVAVGAGLPGVVYGTVAGNAALGLAMLVAAHREAKRRWGRSWARGRWADLAGHRREIGRFFALSDLTALCNTAIKNSDVLILGLFRPAVEVGYYNLGKSLASQVLVLTSAVRSVAFPTIMRLWAAGAWDEIWRTVRSHTWRLAGAGIPAVAALILAMGWALRMVYGVDYVPAAPVARLLLLQVVLVLLTMWLDMVLVAWGQARLLLVTRALGALVVVGGTFLLAPFWGIQAAAAMLLLQQVISALITTSWMHAHRRAGRREAQRRSRIRPSAAPDC